MCSRTSSNEDAPMQRHLNQFLIVSLLAAVSAVRLLTLIFEPYRVSWVNPNFSMETNSSSYQRKCQCCLSEIALDSFLEISESIEQKFFEFTSLNVSFEYNLAKETNESFAAHDFRKTFIEDLLSLQ